MKGSINIRYISAYYYILGDPDPSHEHWTILRFTDFWTNGEFTIFILDALTFILVLTK